MDPPPPGSCVDHQWVFLQFSKEFPRWKRNASSCLPDHWRSSYGVKKRIIGSSSCYISLQELLGCDLEENLNFMTTWPVGIFNSFNPFLYLLFFAGLCGNSPEEVEIILRPGLSLGYRRQEVIAREITLLIQWNHQLYLTFYKGTATYYPFYANKEKDISTNYGIYVCLDIQFMLIFFIRFPQDSTLVVLFGLRRFHLPSLWITWLMAMTGLHNYLIPHPGKLYFLWDDSKAYLVTKNIDIARLRNEVICREAWWTPRVTFLLRDEFQLKKHIENLYLISNLS